MDLLPKNILNYRDSEKLSEGEKCKETLKWVERKLHPEDFKSIKFGEDGLVVIEIKEEKMLKLSEEMETLSQQAEYDRKYMELRERVGEKVVEYLIGTPIDPDILIKYLPSRELIEEDFKQYYTLFGLSCGYHTPTEGLLSIELAKKLAKGESIDEYPEKLEYHYYHYPKETISVCNATFTKTEFLESIKKEKVKKLEKK